MHIRLRTLCALAIAFSLAACASAPQSAPIKNHPLSAIAVSQCGLAVALFIQLDATHLLRADPRQSDLFVAKDGQQRQQSAAPMKWDDAFRLAQSAALTSHVILPCTEGPTVMFSPLKRHQFRYARDSAIDRRRVA